MPASRPHRADVSVLVPQAEPAMLLADVLSDASQKTLGPRKLDAENSEPRGNHDEGGARRNDQDHSQGQHRHTHDENDQSSSLPIGNINESLDHEMGKPRVRGQPDQS